MKKICVACAMKRRMRVNPETFTVGKCKDCGETRVIGEAVKRD